MVTNNQIIEELKEVINKISSKKRLTISQEKEIRHLSTKITWVLADMGYNRSKK